MNTQIIETLENRIAPASVLTFTDVDGDTVKVISSVGDLNAAGVATFDPSGHQLYLLTLTDPSFENADINTIVKKSRDGDGLVNIGRIEGSGNDLGKILIKGDLGGIICGDGNAATGPGLKLLSVGSMGVYGTATQGGGDLSSVVEGTLSTLLIRGDVVGASIGARSLGPDGSDGKIGKAIIGGSVIGRGVVTGSLFSTGDIGLLTIGGNLIGGEGGSTGQVNCGGKIGFLNIKGSIIGGEGFFSGGINGNELGVVRIAGDLLAGTGIVSGAITANKIGKLTIEGGVIGGVGNQKYISGNTNVQGQIIVEGDVGSLKISGDVVGKAGTASGTIQAFGDVGSITIGGNLVGGSGLGTGKIDVFGNLTNLKINGSIIGGSGPQNDFVADGINHEGQVFALGEIGTVSIGGGVYGGTGIATGEIRSGGDMRSVKIGGSLIGTQALASGQLASGGAMGKIQIGGDVIGGADLYSGFIISSAGIDQLTIGGSLIGGSAGRTGEILAGGDIGTLKLGGSLLGGGIDGTQGSLDSNGYIHARRIDSLVIGGSIVAGLDTSTGGELTNNASVRVTNDIGKITVKGSILGNAKADGVTIVTISARGQAALAPGATTDVAIGSIQIGGRVEFTNILGGFDQDDSVAAGSNGNASIGPVKVGGNWVASNLTAGVQDGGLPGFGTAAETVINSPPGAATDGIVARIASITIKGLVVGTAATDTQFGFMAQQIGSFKSLGFTAALTDGTDPALSLSPTTADVTLREI